MAARAKKTNRSKRIDSVRASRDGHQFHEAWVARRARSSPASIRSDHAKRLDRIFGEDSNAVIEAVRALLAGEELHVANRAALAGGSRTTRPAA